MQKDYVTLARTNRLIALATLATRKTQIATGLTNVHQFPVSANRNAKPVPMFTSTRGKRAGDLLAA